MKDEFSKKKIKNKKTNLIFGVIILIQLIYFGLYIGLYCKIMIERIRNDLMQGYISISVFDLNQIFISIGILLLISIIFVLRETYVGNSYLVGQISLFYFNILLCFIFSLIYIFSSFELIPLKIPVENEISSCSGILAIECAILSLNFLYNIKMTTWNKKKDHIKKEELIKLTIFLIVLTQIISISLISHENLKFQMEPQAQNTVTRNLNMIQNPHININFKNNSNIDSFFMGNTTDGLSLDSAYIIEDYSFDYDFSPNPSGIYIYNCSRFLLIKNCSFKGYYSGLYTAYSSNIRIENCYFTQLSRSVYTALSNDISIVNNTIQNCNDAGIELSYSNNNLIERNNLINNSDGINLLSSNNNTIQMNKITNHYFTGINNLWAENNVIYNNEISSNRFFGIKISNSQNTTIWYNIFTKNGKFNAYTSVSVNFNSQDQIKTPNKWDNGSVGNFWDDYLFNNPFGIKQDGFWKKKYTIPGLSSEFDHHPLIHPNDNIRFNSTMLFIIILVSGIACISIMAYKSIRKNISREENFFVRQFSDN